MPRFIAGRVVSGRGTASHFAAGTVPTRGLAATPDPGRAGTRDQQDRRQQRDPDAGTGVERGPQPAASGRQDGPPGRAARTGRVEGPGWWAGSAPRAPAGVWSRAASPWPARRESAVLPGVAVQWRSRDRLSASDGDQGQEAVASADRHGHRLADPGLHPPAGSMAALARASAAEDRPGLYPARSRAVPRSALRG